jgi:hypothetical protein
MISLVDLLLEKRFKTYSTLVLIEHSYDSFMTNVLDEIRAVARVVIVNNETPENIKENTGLIRVKIITTKPPRKAFELVKKDALTNIPDLKSFKYDPNKIQQVD